MVNLHSYSELLAIHLEQESSTIRTLSMEQCDLKQSLISSICLSALRCVNEAVEALFLLKHTIQLHRSNACVYCVCARNPFGSLCELVCVGGAPQLFTWDIFALANFRCIGVYLKPQDFMLLWNSNQTSSFVWPEIRNYRYDNYVWKVACRQNTHACVHHFLSFFYGPS